MGDTAYKARQKAKGLCICCSSPARYPYVRCDDCMEVDRVKATSKMKRLKIQRKADNECPQCGIRLHPDMDKGRTNCLNCREHI